MLFVILWVCMGNTKQPDTLAAMLRRAIAESGMNRNQLAKAAGIQYSALWRFLAN